MNNELVLICGPVSTRSGYGAHARDIFHSFYDIGKYDIMVADVRWGDTPRNALNIDNQKDKLIIDRLLQGPVLDRQPDIYVDIRIPNEFQQIGKFNIGITAGIETTVVSTAWVEGCNKIQSKICLSFSLSLSNAFLGQSPQRTSIILMSYLS